MSEGFHGFLLEHAAQQLAREQHQAAIASLRQYLAAEPDSSRGHALLALALFASRRLAAAEHEARLALQLDPESPIARRALARIAMAQRRFKEARKLLDEALASSPEDEDVHLALAHLHHLRGDRDAETRSLETARSLAPGDLEVILAQGRAALARGKLAAAYEQARAMLAINPEDARGQILLGRIALRRGQLEEARELAVSVLRMNGANREALEFLTEVKTRGNWFLGLWWRMNTSLNELGSRSSIAVLVVAYMAQLIATQVARDHHNRAAADLVTYAWLGICLYSWVAPGVLSRLLAKELQEVKLRSDF